MKRRSFIISALFLLITGITFTACNGLYNLMNTREISVENKTNSSVKIDIRDNRGHTLESLNANETKTFNVILPFENITISTESNNGTINYSIDKIDVLKYEINEVDKVLFTIINQLEVPVTVKSIYDTNFEVKLEAKNNTENTASHKFYKSLIRKDKNENGDEIDVAQNPFYIVGSKTDENDYRKNYILDNTKNNEEENADRIYYKFTNTNTTTFTINEETKPVSN